MPQFRRAAGRVLPAVMLCAIAGCAPVRTVTPAPPPPGMPTTGTDRAAGVDSPPGADTVEVREVAILFEGSSSDYADVAAQLIRLLPPERYRLTPTDIHVEDSQRILGGLGGRPGLLVVAIGLRAARFARDQLSAPVVFAQVFNHQELLVEGRLMRGIAAIPPLDLQLQDWKKVDPGLHRVGLIVSDRHADLIREAEQAARTTGVTIQHEISSSDQETLYLFKRLVPGIDGFWLVPDDRILSPAVLRELLGYAVSHNVRVSVFSDSLLEWGAVLSASATAPDVARTVRDVLERMIAGDAGHAPALTPLSEVAVRINATVANRLGLASPAGASWIVRSEP